MKKNKKLTPLEAIEETLGSIILYNGYMNHGHHLGEVSEAAFKRLGPGAMVKRMPERIRQGLRRLKSHHFDSMCMDKWRFMDDAYERKKRASEELMEFDKKILR